MSGHHLEWQASLCLIPDLVLRKQLGFFVDDVPWAGTVRSSRAEHPSHTTDVPREYDASFTRRQSGCLVCF